MPLLMGNILDSLRVVLCSSYYKRLTYDTHLTDKANNDILTISAQSSMCERWELVSRNYVDDKVIFIAVARIR